MGYKTQIMGASFRNTDEILELAGCDLLTIAPKLLDELQKASGDVPCKLSPEAAKKADIQKITVDEKTFRWMLCYDAMASDKLYEGIRNFSKDIVKLQQLLSSRM
jgi:transaldolase